MKVVEQTPALFGLERHVAAEDVDVRLQARQRRAQLVRGIGDEAALRLERLLERGEHRIEGRAEARELVLPAFGNTLARLAGLRDPFGRRREAAHRSQGRARDEGARRSGGGDPAERHEDQDEP